MVRSLPFCCVLLSLALFAGGLWAQSATPAEARADGEAEPAGTPPATAVPGEPDGGEDRDGARDGEAAAASPGPTGPAGTASGGASSAVTPPPPRGDAEAGQTSQRSQAAVDGATYAVRMRDLAQRIDELKEQIRRSHTRLSLLSDSILARGIGGARAEIRFVNELSHAFRLTSVLFVLDGQVQYSKRDDGGVLTAQRSVPVFTGTIPPGDHTLQVQLKLQGHGFGVFSYLRGYRFETGASHSFTVTEGKVVVLEAVAWEKGGVTTPLEERPAIRFKQVVKAVSERAEAAPGGSRGAARSRPAAGGAGDGATGGR